jgi:hypothetical protein
MVYLFKFGMIVKALPIKMYILPMPDVALMKEPGVLNYQKTNTIIIGMVAKQHVP